MPGDLAALKVPSLDPFQTMGGSGGTVHGGSVLPVWICGFESVQKVERLESSGKDLSCLKQGIPNLLGIINYSI